jgi:hypothetical protein
MINITFTAKQCRLVADIIKFKPASEVTKLICELRDKVLDTLVDSDPVIISTDSSTIIYVYPLLNEISGEIDTVRGLMKESLLEQIEANIADEEWQVLAQGVQAIVVQNDNRADYRITSGKNFLNTLR